MLQMHQAQQGTLLVPDIPNIHAEIRLPAFLQTTRSVLRLQRGTSQLEAQALKRSLKRGHRSIDDVAGGSLSASRVWNQR